MSTIEVSNLSPHSLQMRTSTRTNLTTIYTVVCCSCLHHILHNYNLDVSEIILNIHLFLSYEWTYCLLDAVVDDVTTN